MWTASVESILPGLRTEQPRADDRGFENWQRVAAGREEATA